MKESLFWMNQLNPQQSYKVGAPTSYNWGHNSYQ